MLNFQPKILKGLEVQLELLQESHQDELYQAAQDEKIWVYASSTAFGEKFQRWFTKALVSLQREEQLPFVVRRLSDGRILGSSRYYDIDYPHRKLSMGYTWYIPEVWGTSVNVECKRLLLTLAFEEWQFNRIEFAIDSRNTRSCAAIKKMGAIQEGILRQHLILEDGFIRDTVLFSIIKPDWPRVKALLQARLPP